MKKIIKLVLLTSFGLLHAAQSSAQDYSGSKYNSNNVQTMQTVTLGYIEAMREVTVDAQTQVGAYSGMGLGALVGGLLGSSISDHRTTKTAGTVILGAAGAITGNYLSQAIAREKAYEYIIKLNDGRVVAVTQSYENANHIEVGDRVRILQNGKVRIVKMI